MSKAAKYPVREDLYCPSCGHQGMRQCVDKAQSGRKRYRCMSCGTRTTQPSYAPVQVLPKTRVTDIRQHKVFVITSAVNDTPLVDAAFKTFKTVADANGGCLLVIPTVYKNPDLYHAGGGLTYPEEILPYICNVNFNLNQFLTVKGLTRIEHTVINPLTGLNHAGGPASEIYAHSQVSMDMVPTPKSKTPKMLHTTGTISQPNYSGATRAQKASHHHSISALIVEIEGSRFWTRELHFDGEGCYDLDRYYWPNGTYSHGWPVAAVVHGDVHVQALDPKVRRLTDHANALLKPEYKIYHDLHDHHIGSHHHTNDTINWLKLAKRGELSVRDELMKSVRFLNRNSKSYVVDSNHHRHLDQWFNRFNPNRDALNLPLYYELAGLLDADLDAGGDGNLFRLFVHKYCKSDVEFISPDSPFFVRSIDCSQHGDRGANGSKGSKRVFAKTGYKSMIGHGHGPGIEKGCYQVGTLAAGNLDYVHGLTSECNTSGIIYDNGKRALFSIIDNKLSPMMREAAR